MEMKSLTVSNNGYMSAIYSAATYNQWLLKDRQQRIPCLERQTQRRHVECTLWYRRYHRQTDEREGYLYTYPHRIEPQKNSDPSYMFDYDVPLLHGIGISEGSVNVDGAVCSNGNISVPNGNNVSNGGAASTMYIDIDEALLYADQQLENKEELSSYLREPIQLTDDHHISSYIHLHNTSNASLNARGKKRKPGRPSRSTPSSKVFPCHYCEACYRTKGGLVYHLAHKHLSEQQAERREKLYSTYTPPVTITATSTTPPHTQIGDDSHYDHMPGVSSIKDAAVHLEDRAMNGENSSKSALKPTAYIYCNGNVSTYEALTHSDIDDNISLITMKKKKRKRAKQDQEKLNMNHNNNNNNNKGGDAEGPEHKKKKKKRKKIKVEKCDDGKGVGISQGACENSSGCINAPVTIPVSVSLMHIEHKSNASSDTESYSLQEEQDD